jgi:glycine/D-amino acid oxidase-like deaminating enzyme
VRWDTIIVGAGIAGLSLAEALTRTEAGRLLIIDTARVGAGASTRNAGRLTHAHCTTPERAVLARAARRALFTLQHRLASSFSLQQLGEMTVLYQEAEAERAVNEVLPALRSAGLSGRLIGPGQIGVQMADYNPDGAVAALLVDDSIALHHDAVIYALLRTVLRRGVTIKTGAAVHRLLCDQGTVGGVVVGATEYQAQRVILCCAEGSLALLAGLGWQIPLNVVRQQTLIIASIRDRHWPIVRWTGPAGAGSCHRVARGEVLAACQRPGGDPQRNSGCTPDFLARTSRELGNKLPILGTSAVIRQWGGVTTKTADDLPYAGPVPSHTGLWVLFGMNAFTHYPLFAEHLARAVRGEESSGLLERAALTPARGVRGSLPAPISKPA